jgi:hypothetical protein
MGWHMSFWLVAIIVYVSLALMTATPILQVTFLGIRLNPGGASFRRVAHPLYVGFRLAIT